MSVLLAPTDIRTVWSELKPELEQLKKWGPYSRWIPEDVYADCRHGAALLFYEAPNFIVVKDEVEAISGRRILWVWLAKGRGVIEMQPRLDAFARNQGYDEIRFTSPRRGWERTPGWQMIETTYRREL